MDEAAQAFLSRIIELRVAAEQAARASSSAENLTIAKRRFIGKSSPLMALRRELGSLPPEHRKTLGAELNAAIARVGDVFGVRENDLAASALPRPIDVTLPPILEPVGRLHPSVQLMYDLNDAFVALNFEIYEGPEISSEYFEFDLMNFPADHPARESMDTYWLKGTDDKRAAKRLCLRPHLTGASVRYMLEHEPPFRFVYPGRVYRNEEVDARHERAFFQYEALIIDRDISITSGKFLVDTILDTVFGKPVRTRMRSGFFPFVEPGFEIDMECQVCAGTGCRTCHQVGWLEIMPGGVPHPQVLEAGGLDPQVWSGFYVNVGLDRLVMMRYGIDDIRLLHEADLAFLTQFS